MAKRRLQLGRPAAMPASPQEAVLDRVANPQADTNYVARFTAPEFTTLCPITGQPDFAHLVIDYVPAKFLVESKSLKLYLARYRDQGAFCEALAVQIRDEVAAALELEAARVRVTLKQKARGGITISASV